MMGESSAAVAAPTPMEVEEVEMGTEDTAMPGPLPAEAGGDAGHGAAPSPTPVHPPPGDEGASGSPQEPMPAPEVVCPLPAPQPEEATPPPGVKEEAVPADVAPPPASPAPAAVQPSQPLQTQCPASKDDGKFATVPAAHLKMCLTCPICKNLLQHAITAVECLHSFCQDCIESRLEDEERTCPVCNSNVGPDPWVTGKIRFDRTMTEIVKEIFPRPEEDAKAAAKMEERESDLNRRIRALAAEKARKEKETRQNLESRAQAQATRRGASTRSGAPRAGTNQYGMSRRGAVAAASYPGCEEPQVQLALVPSAEQHAAGLIAKLPKPYVQTQASVAVSTVRKYVAQKLAALAVEGVGGAGEGASGGGRVVKLQCRGTDLHDGFTLGTVLAHVWEADSQWGHGGIMVLDYSVHDAAPIVV